MVWCRRPVGALMTIATRDVTFDIMRHLRFLVEEPSASRLTRVGRNPTASEFSTRLSWKQRLDFNDYGSAA